MSAAPKKDNVLVLGGGDGMAVRELLKDKDTEITLVDLDAQMIELCSENPNITALNEHSLDSSRLTIICEDAYQFLQENTKTFDVIIVDLPDPNNESLNKLYTNIFYRLCYGALAKDGVMTVQSTSPYYASDAFWCIHDTLESECFSVYPYHLQAPSFSYWGFHLAAKQPISTDLDMEKAETRYLTEETIPALFVFGKDEQPKRDIEINALSKPVLIQYYADAVRNWE